MRPSGPQPRQGADRALVSDGRDFDGITLPHHGKERDDPVIGEVDVLDALALLLQDDSLLEHDVLEMRLEQRELFGRESTQEQIAPTGTRAIQLHLGSSPAVRAGAAKQTIGQRSDHASARAGERYATGMEL